MKTNFKLSFLLAILALFSSLDLNAQKWESCFTFFPDHYTIHSANNLIYIADKQRGVMFSQNLGNNWTFAKMNGNFGNETTMSIMSKDSIMYACTQYNIYKSKNFGNDWDLTNTERLWDSNYYPISANIAIIVDTLAIVGTDYGVITSSIFRDNWKYNNKGLNDKSIASLISSNGYILAGTKMNTLYRSSDMGVNWIKVGIDSLTFYTFYNFNNSLYAGTNQGVFRSSDDGLNWEKLSNGIYNYAVISITSNGNNLYCATTKGVFLSKNNGTYWQSIGLDSAFINSLAVLKNTLFAANGFVYKYDLTTGIENSNSSETSEISIYPNPIQNNFTIEIAAKFDISVPINFSIKSITGQELINFESTETKFEVSTNNLPSGIYYLTAVQGTKQVTKMITVVK